MVAQRLQGAPSAKNAKHKSTEDDVQEALLAVRSSDFDDEDDDALSMFGFLSSSWTVSWTIQPRSRRTFSDDAEIT